MGRYLPVECEHGTIIDYGDFGPCQDCSEHQGQECPNLPDCEQCEAQRKAKADALAQVHRDAVWLAKLARGSSWPGEMAQRVEDAAARVIARFSDGGDG